MSKSISIRSIEQLRESLRGDGYGLYFIQDGKLNKCLEIDYIPKTDKFLVADLNDNGVMQRLTATEFMDQYGTAMKEGQLIKDVV